MPGVVDVATYLTAGTKTLHHVATSDLFAIERMVTGLGYNVRSLASPLLRQNAARNLTQKQNHLFKIQFVSSSELKYLIAINFPDKVFLKGSK
jgi:hypothetical protein